MNKLKKRLLGFCELERGWYDGDGVTFDKSKVLKLIDLIEKYFNGPKLPIAWANPNGLITLEWRNTPLESSLDIDLNLMTGEYFRFELHSDDSNDLEYLVDLNDKQDWDKITQDTDYIYNAGVLS